MEVLRERRVDDKKGWDKRREERGGNSYPFPLFGYSKNQKEGERSMYPHPCLIVGQKTD